MMRPHIELARLDMNSGWQGIPGFPAGIEIKILSDGLDEVRKTGARVRFVRLAPNAHTGRTLTHDYWEETYLQSGDLSPPDSTDEFQWAAPTYSCRPPGTPHGPFTTRSGCLFLEIQYYAKEDG